MKWQFTFIVIAILVLIAWYCSPTIFSYLADKPSVVAASIKDTAAVSNIFGLLNTLFTGIALSAIVVAIFIQIEQLKKQDRELALYKDEIDKTARRVQQEAELDLLKLKMDIVPQICRRLEFQVSTLLGENWSLEERFSESPARLTSITDEVNKKIEMLSTQIRWKEEERAALAEKIRIKSETYSNMTEDEKTAFNEDFVRRIQSGEVNPNFGDPLKAFDSDIERLSSQQSPLKQVSELLNEIRSLQDDLNRAYKDARRQV